MSPSRPQVPRPPAPRAAGPTPQRRRADASAGPGSALPSPSVPPSGPTKAAAGSAKPATGPTKPAPGSTKAASGSTKASSAAPTAPTRTPPPPPPASSGAPATAPVARSVATYTAGRRLPAVPAPRSVVSSTSAARFEERARARRALARRQVVTIAACTAAVLALGWLLFLSPVLALDPAKVTVRGAGSVVAVDRVLEVVRAHAGTPLPRLDTIGLRDDVLDVPGVREARVMRDWPDGIAVTVVAREPVAGVPDAKRGGYLLLDVDGVQVGRVEKAPQGLPVVDVPVGEKRTLEAVLTVLEQLPAELLEQVRGVSAGTRDTVRMELRDDVRVEWGSASETPLKIAVLQTLRASEAAKDATVIDVSAPRLPITR